jgi:hypothetical protein
MPYPLEPVAAVKNPHGGVSEGGCTAKGEGKLADVLKSRSRSDLSSPTQDESLRKQGYAAAAATMHRVAVSACDV